MESNQYRERIGSPIPVTDTAYLVVVHCLTSLCPPLSIIGKYVATGDIAPVSCVKKRRGKGFCYSLLRYPFLFSIVIAGAPLLVATSPMVTWPLLLVWTQGRGRGLAHLSPLDRDDASRRHCLDDLAHPLTCQIVVIRRNGVRSCCRRHASSSFRPFGWWGGIATL